MARSVGRARSGWGARAGRQFLACRLSGGAPARFGRTARRAAVALVPFLSAAAVLAAAPIASAPAWATAPNGTSVVGVDISFPQCGSIFPSGQAFGIVGVNDGMAGTLNPCLGPDPSYTASELYWAVSSSTGSTSQPAASLYVNTGDPGDVFNGSPVSSWPTSSSGADPYGACTTTTVPVNGGTATVGADSNACAWQYGDQEAAQDVSWLGQAATAIDAQSPPVNVPGNAGNYPWWLDVETANSWQSGAAGQAMNVAVLQGTVAGLRAAGASSIGVYSISDMWASITGGTDASTPSLGGLANWVPGAGDEAGAEADCGDVSFTGGPVELSQWTTSVDNDIVCGSPLNQIYGPDAVATSIAISEQEFPAAGSAKAVVLARSDFFSDALAGGPLAAQDGAPLLITPGAAISTTLDPRVETEIERVLPAGHTVYVLGGDLALSPMIDATLQELGYQVVREAGANQYATAVDIAEAMGNPTTIFEATGLNFYDALSAVPAAIKEHAAILLTDGATQAPETALYLARFPVDTRYAIGGTFAAAGADPTATAVYGQDLFATSAAVATRFFPGAGVFGAATAVDFPDALGGGVFMATGSRSGPLLLVDPVPPIAPTVASYLASLSAKTPGYVFGGTLAVPPGVVAALSAAVG